MVEVKQMTEYYVAWWNLENLYTVMPWAERARKVRNVGGLKRYLDRWTLNDYNTKLGQLAQVIIGMNNGSGPDVLGVCEVEREPALFDLIATIKARGCNRNYATIHHDSPDPRGIDVAFIYDADKFDTYAKSPNAAEDSPNRRHWFTHEIVKRYPTRDLFQVNLCPKGNRSRPFILIGNHWPSRMDGTHESAPYRMIAGETLSYFGKRIRQEYGAKTPVLVMGDFNDQPGDRSMTEYALSTHSIVKATSARGPTLYNLMWEIMGQNTMTYWHKESGPLFFDQFLVSNGFLKSGSTFTVVKNSLEVIRTNAMWDKTEYVSCKKPYRFGWKTRNPPGFSDHYPIAVKIELH